MVQKNSFTIDLWDLCNENVYVKINEMKTRNLLKKVIDLVGNQRKLARLLSKSEGAITFYKVGTNPIPLDIIIKLIDLFPSNEHFLLKKKIRDSVTHVKVGHGKSKLIKIRFPIDFSKNMKVLAMLSGHIVGDGGISKLDKLFYSNGCKVLIDRFKLYMDHLFGETGVYQYKYENDCIMIAYSKILGIILRKIIGKMNAESKHVPDFVLNSTNKEVKFAFLSALFDDECNVDVDKHMIQIGISNEDIIADTKEILLELGIETGKTTIKEPSDNRKAKYIFRICGKKNLERFSKLVGLNHTSKRQDLNKLLDSYKGKGDEKRYTKFGQSEGLIVNVLKNGSATPLIISNKLNRPKSSLKCHLQTLEKAGKIGSIRLRSREKLYYLNNNMHKVRI